MISLGNVFLLKRVREFCVHEVDFCQRRLAENDHEFFRVFSARIRGEELVHGVGVVGPCLALADPLILQTGQGREHVDGRHDPFPVEFAA